MPSVYWTDKAEDDPPTLSPLHFVPYTLSPTLCPPTLTPLHSLPHTYSSFNSLARNSLAPKTPLAIPLPIFRPEPAGASETLARLIEPPQTKAVKIYGAAGNRNLPAHQSGFLFSSQGQVLTAWSYVLDTDQISVWTSRSRWRSASGYSLSATSPRSTTTSAARSGPERVTKRFANRPNPGPPPGWACTWHPTCCRTSPPFIDRILPDAPAARAGFQPDDLILSFPSRSGERLLSLASPEPLLPKQIAIPPLLSHYAARMRPRPAVRHARTVVGVQRPEEGPHGWPRRAHGGHRRFLGSQDGSFPAPRTPRHTAKTARQEILDIVDMCTIPEVTVG